MSIKFDDNGLIHEIEVSKVAPSISYLFFANDNFMICNFYIDEVREVKRDFTHLIVKFLANWYILIKSSMC